MFTLALDCSTARGSVALGGGRAPWRVTFAAGRGCGGEMFVALQDALREIAAADGRLGEIIVGLGPGSYSGVRQAIAAATGLAAATGAALRGLPSAVALPSEQSGFQAVGDARRGTFYHTAVQRGVCVSGPELLESAAALIHRLAERPDWPAFAVESALPGGLLSQARVVFPAAEALLAAPPTSRQNPPLEPIYLRPVSITLPRAARASEP